jgi:hypothetical protein
MDAAVIAQLAGLILTLDRDRAADARSLSLGYRDTLSV